MAHWLQPWLEPTVLASSVGALLAGLGLFLHRFASTLPELRVTVDWWDDRRDRRREQRRHRRLVRHQAWRRAWHRAWRRDGMGVAGGPPEPRSRPVIEPPAPRQELAGTSADRVAGSTVSTQLTLELDEPS